MKKLLNTLYVTSPDSYLSLDGENIIVNKEEGDKVRFPLHNLEGVVTFGYKGASPALMEACAKRKISFSFMSRHGRFMVRVMGEENGNVLLRKEQYRISDNELRSLKIAKNMIVAKLYNSRSVIERATRDYPMRIDVEKFKGVSKQISETIPLIRESQSLDELRGYEGKAASQYFSIFNDLILQQTDDFRFTARNRRPPVDNINAMLSFMYSILGKEVASALESVGLDAYVGFLHQDKPGRISLALDMMEEFRAIYVDRFILTLINKKMVSPSGFETRDDGAIIMKDNTRRTLLSAWQEKKQETLKHPFLLEKIEWGMVPFVQSLLLARYIRGDLDEYPPFFWK